MCEGMLHSSRAAIHISYKVGLLAAIHMAGGGARFGRFCFGLDFDSLGAEKKGTLLANSFNRQFA